MKNKNLIYGALVVGFLAYLFNKKDSSTTVQEDKANTPDVGNDKNDVKDESNNTTSETESNKTPTVETNAGPSVETSGNSSVPQAYNYV